MTYANPTALLSIQLSDAATDIAEVDMSNNLIPNWGNNLNSVGVITDISYNNALRTQWSAILRAPSNSYNSSNIIITTRNFASSPQIHGNFTYTSSFILPFKYAVTTCLAYETFIPGSQGKANAQ